MKGGQTRTEGGQSGIVRHGFPPFLPGRTGHNPLGCVRLSGQGASRTEFKELATHSAYPGSADKPANHEAYLGGSFLGGACCGDAEPQRSNLLSKNGTRS